MRYIIIEIRTILLFTILLLCQIHVLQAQTMDKIDSASQMYNAGNWEKSVTLYSSLVDMNPYHPEYKVRLAFSLQRRGNYTSAIDMYKKAIDIGPFPDIYWYQIAICYARLKDSVNTLSSIQQALKNRWPRYEQLENEKDFAFIRNSKTFRNFLGLTLPDKATRTEKWKADFFFLRNRLKELHYNLYNTNSPEIWQNTEKEILRNIQKKTDSEIILSFMNYAALAGEGHTKILPPKQGDTAFHTLPFVLYRFKDGFYVTECMLKDEVLIGKKVTAIGGIAIDKLFDFSYGYWGHENEFHHKKITPKVMLMTEVLREKGIWKNKEPLSVSYIDAENNNTVYEIRPQTIGQFESVKVTDKKFMHNTAVQLPLYRQNAEQDYWFKSDQAISMMYLKIKYILNQDKTTFKSFIDSMFRKLDDDKCKNLVLDLRDCGGGNATLNRLLIEQILKRPQINSNRNFYTIIGRNTYSAAINLVGDLEFRTNTTFIGEPTGSSPNYIGESNTLKLPYSKLYLIISNRYHQTGANTSFDKRKWYAPSVFIEPSSTDYKLNLDPVMDYIRESLTK